MNNKEVVRINEVLDISLVKLEEYKSGKQTPRMVDISELKYDLRVALSDLHALLKLGIDKHTFHSLRTEIDAVLEMCDDLRKDLNGRAQAVEAAIIAISKERFEGELWREVLQLARDMKNNTEL